MHNCTFVKIMQILISHWTQLSCCTHIAQFWLIIIWRLKCPDWKFYIWGSYRQCKQTLWSKDRTKSCSGKFSFIKKLFVKGGIFVPRFSTNILKRHLSKFLVLLDYNYLSGRNMHCWTSHKRISSPGRNLIISAELW